MSKKGTIRKEVDATKVAFSKMNWQYLETLKIFDCKGNKPALKGFDPALCKKNKSPQTQTKQKVESELRSLLGFSTN